MTKDLEDVIGKEARKGNPFRGIYVPEKAQEILDIAFKRALRSSPPGGERLDLIKRKKSVVISRIKTLSDEISSRLLDIVKRFPSIDTMHPFYTSILELWMSRDDYKKTLSKIHGASRLVKRIARDYILRIRATRWKEGIPVGDVLKTIDKLRGEVFGRISSVVNSLNKDFSKLANIVKKMKKLPDYDPTLPAIVVAGPPNSGKSSFVKAVSNAKVEIASYPFTTKNITFGHIELKSNGIIIRRVQIADTPGLFDRPINERKEPELLALKAIQYLADVILFLFDGSTEAVMESNEQLRVYYTVRRFFGEGKPFIIAINKIDIANEDIIRDILEKLGLERDNIFFISIKEYRNIDRVLDKIKKILRIS